MAQNRIVPFINDLPWKLNDRFMPPAEIELSAACTDEIVFPIELVDEEYLFTTEHNALNDFDRALAKEQALVTALAETNSDVVGTLQQKDIINADNAEFSNSNGASVLEVTNFYPSFRLFETVGPSSVKSHTNVYPLPPTAESSVPVSLPISWHGSDRTSETITMHHHQPALCVTTNVVGSHVLSIPRNSSIPSFVPQYVGCTGTLNRDSEILTPIPVGYVRQKGSGWEGKRTDDKLSLSDEKKSFNGVSLADFEGESSPFDSMALKTLNVWQELQTVLQSNPSLKTGHGDARAPTINGYVNNVPQVPGAWSQAQISGQSSHPAVISEHVQQNCYDTQPNHGHYVGLQLQQQLQSTFPQGTLCHNGVSGSFTGVSAWKPYGVEQNNLRSCKSLPDLTAAEESLKPSGSTYELVSHANYVNYCNGVGIGASTTSSPVCKSSLVPK